MLNNRQQRRYDRLSGIQTAGGTLNANQQNRLNNLSNMKNNQGGAQNPIKQTSGVQSNIFGTFNNEFGAQSGDMFKPIDFNALPSAPNTQNLGAERQRIEDELYGRYTRDFDSQKAREKEAFDQQMADRGIGVGSGQAYSNAYNDFEKNWANRYDSARSQAVEAGGQEFERNFNIGTSGRANALNEQAFSKQFPMQQLTSLMGLGSAVGNLNLGFRNLRSNNRNQKANRKLQIQLANLNNAAAMERLQASMAGSGGGGYAPPSPPPPPF